MPGDYSISILGERHFRCNAEAQARDDGGRVRPLPQLLPETEDFWTGGREDRLRIKRCPTCSRLWHPSQVVCGDCHHTELESVDASGRGVVIGFTVNVQQWLPDLEPPYVIAIVALDDDPRVRLFTNIVGAEPEAVHVGLRVGVQFEQHDDVWLPVFAPVSGPARWSSPTSSRTASRSLA